MVLLALAHASDAPADVHLAEAVATGDCALVLSALPDPDTDPLRLAAARCALKAGDPARAARLAGAVTGELAPYAALTEATALSRTGAWSEARAALEGVALEGSDDELTRGAVLLAAGDAAGALAAYLAVTSASAASTAGEARARELSGDKPGANAAWLRVWTTWPTSAEAAEAELALARLGTRVPDVTTAEGRTAARARADKLLALSQADRAVPLLDALLAAGPAPDAETTQRMAEALFAAKLYPRAVEWYGRVNTSRATAATLFSEALATARSGDYAGATAKYGDLARRFPGTSQADEAAYKPPYMDYDAGRYDAAVAGFDRYVAGNPKGKFVVDARWFRAWSLHKLGRDTDALAALDALVAAHPSSELAVGARYWRARLRGDGAALRALIDASPHTGYAWFAAQRLGVRFPAPTVPATTTLPATFVAAHPRTRLAEQLLAAGLVDLARPPLRADLEAARTAGESVAVPYAYALVRAELYAEAQKLAAPWCGKASAREACSPRPYAATLAQLTHERLEPLLPYAIMNAESGLDRKVVSPAGAIGLMQLMPSLAQQLAATALPGFVETDLYGAGVNARLGTLELVQLQADVGAYGLPATIAGYNGGAAAVKRWVSMAPTTPEMDQFAEDIGYTETRRYVRRVLGFLMRYQRTYGR